MRLTLSVLLLSVGLLTAGTAAQEDDFYPNTRERGRAAIEYDDDVLQIVAAYYHSQDNHDSPWLLIEAAVSAKRVVEIQRDGVRLITPGGRELPLASQRRFAEDIWRIRPLLQRVSVTRHDVVSYFKLGAEWPMRFFALPFQGVVQDSFVVLPGRVAWGDLFFVSPTGRWDPGTYSLIVQHEAVRAAVPIRLE